MTYKHGKSVSCTEENGNYTEYDEYDRITFYKDINEYWALKFYDDPKEKWKPNVIAHTIVHKYWPEYNNLK